MPAATTLRNLVPWLPTGVAVAFLLISLVTVATYAVRGDSPAPVPVRAAPTLPPFSPEAPPPSADAAIGVAESARSTPAPGTPSPSSSSPAAPPSQAAAPRRVPEAQRSTPGQARSTGAAPPRKGLTGTYRVVDSFDGGVIGEVLIANPTRTDAGWTVTLTVPAAMTGLVTSWVEGAPQATLEVDGRSYTWRSGVPVSAGGTVPLRFHFNRDGGAETPARCTVNGTPCAGLAQ